MQNQWIFLESRNQINAARSNFGSGFQALKKLALSPEACHALEEEGIEHKILEEFFCPSEFQAQEEQNLNKLSSWAELVDSMLRKNISELSHYSLRPVSYDINLFFLLINSVTFKLHSLDRMLSKTSQQKVVYFLTNREETSPSLYFDQESIYSHLIRLVAESRGIQSVALPATEPLRSPISNLKRNIQHAYWRTKTSIGDKHRRIMAWKKRIAKVNLPLRKSNSNLIILWDAINTQGIVEECNQHGAFNVTYWDLRKSIPGTSDSSLHNRDIQNRLVQNWQNLVCDHRFLALFKWHNIDWFQSVEQRLAFFFITSIGRMVDIAEHTLRTFSESKPAAILKANERNHTDLVVTDLALNQGIPVFHYQHGGTIGYIQNYPLLVMIPYVCSERNGLENYVYLTYGNGVRKFCEQATAGHHHIPPKFEAVGSVELDGLRLLPSKQTRGRNRPRILYVTNGFYGNYPYTLLYSDTTYYRFQRDVIRMGARYPQYDFCIKPYPDKTNRNPIPSLIKNLDTKHISILENVRFSKVVHEADLIVVDFPSTTLLQALTTSAPILAYVDSRQIQLDPEARRMIKKRVTLSETPQEFFRTFKHLLSVGDSEWMASSNSEFLEHYGILKEDGNSARRAYDCLVRYTENKQCDLHETSSHLAPILNS